MNKSWEAWTRTDGMVSVQLGEGEVLTVKNDGITGYPFALDYLNRLSHHYKNHLRAADLILRRQVGEETYNRIKKIPNLYNSNLALVSMNCGFGAMDNIPDCDSAGEYHFEFAPCPFRATCPYNGYNPNNRNKVLVCCNPVYELPLTPRQTEIAHLLVNTAYTNTEIAGSLNLTEKAVKYHITGIYDALSVNTRQELTLLLKDKRIY